MKNVFFLTPSREDEEEGGRAIATAVPILFCASSFRSFFFSLFCGFVNEVCERGMKLCEATLLTSAEKKKKKKKEREKTKRQSGLKEQPGFGSGGRSYGKSAGSALQQRGGRLDEREREREEEGGWRGAGDESPLMCLCALCHPASLIHSWKHTHT